jgi:hypothetical protein
MKPIFTMWAPPVISWFRNPSKYPYFCTINHSENGLLWPTNRDDSWPHGGPTLSVARPNRWVIESSRRCRWDSWGAHPRTEPCGGAARRIWETRWGKLGTFHKPPNPNSTSFSSAHPTPQLNLFPSTAAIRWWMRAVNYCQLWPGRGPNISACRPSTCEGWSVLQNPGGWVDQNVPLPRKWELAKNGSYMTAAMLGMLGVTIYIYI